MGVPDVRPEPADATPCTPPGCSRSARGSTPPRRASRTGGCAAARPCARASSAACSSSSPVTENGEHGATPIRSIESNDGSWCVSIAASVAARMASMSSTTLSGGRPPLLWPRSIEPRVGWNRRPTRPGRVDLGAEQVAAVVREDVVVVGGRRAAGLRQPGQGAGGRGPGDVGVEPAPDRVERGQPLEQRAVDGEAAGHPLVEVVVGVDEARRDQAAAAVDPAALTCSSGARPAPTAMILLSSTHDVPAGVLRPVRRRW